tara:strand:- start:138 stop:656 length:519 start_codon:yes stop_codon:yes gene_type:complete
MKIKILPIILFLLFLIIFVIFYKGLKNTNFYTPTLNNDAEIPSFTARNFDGNDEVVSDKIFNFDNFYIMNIWASWCIPCREEHSYLEKLSQNTKIEIVGLNYKDNPINAKKFLTELGNPYKIILSDPNGIISIEWGAYGVPETYLIHKKKILRKFIGPLNDNSFSEIMALIK